MAEKITKTCVRCKQELPHSEFHKARNRPDGLYPYCRPCNRQWREDRKRADPEAYEARRARKREYDAVYNEKHRAKKAAQVKARYERKAEEVKANIKRWQSENKERVNAYKKANKQNRRAAQEVGISGAELHKWQSEQPKKCYWCGCGCKRNYHVDHYVPLSKGGKHELANLVIACGPCNLRKNAKDPLDFAREIGRLM
jgi:5-methylcytosine-specific restriction endonuclease McrA